jgi:hypothetical protein
MRASYPTEFLSCSHFKHSEEVGGGSGSAVGPSCLAPLRFFLTWACALPLNLRHAYILFFLRSFLMLFLLLAS